MSDEPSLSTKITQFIDEVTCDAGKAERERSAEFLLAAKRAAVECGDDHVAGVLDDCRHALLTPGTNPIFTFKSPPPPAPEPMTIPKLIEKLKQSEVFFGNWTKDEADSIAADLLALVEAQVWRDAEFVRGLVPHMASEREWIADELLKSAGLE